MSAGHENCPEGCPAFEAGAKCKKARRCEFDERGFCITSSDVCPFFHSRGTVPAAAPAPAYPPNDLVNDPPHYRSVAGVTLKGGRRLLAGELEALDVIEAFDLGPHLANVIKYCLRAGRKGPDVEDLKKARMYLDRKIARAERGE